MTPLLTLCLQFRVQHFCLEILLVGNQYGNMFGEGDLRPSLTLQRRSTIIYRYHYRLSEGTNVIQYIP